MKNTELPRTGFRPVPPGFWSCTLPTELHVYRYSEIYSVGRAQLQVAQLVECKTTWVRIPSEAAQCSLGGGGGGEPSPRPT